MSEKKTHELKTIPPYFEAVQRGIKRFEVRLNDRGYKVGDILLLREYLPQTKQYTGRECYREIDYILDDAFVGLIPGYVVLGIGLVEETPRWTLPQI